MDKWVCIRVSLAYHRGDRNAVTSTIERIFGKDMEEVRFVCDEIMWQSGEYYCFVKCSNYDAHIQTLKDNSLFFGVVPSCERPDWLTEDDVNQFIVSVQDAGKKADFIRGDIVNVKEGYLKNLCGLVVGRHKKKYKVSFHFCIRRFVEYLMPDSLQYMGSLFKSKRFPVSRKSFEEGRVPCSDSELQEALHQVASKHKIHWQTNRGRVKAG